MACVFAISGHSQLPGTAVYAVGRNCRHVGEDVPRYINQCKVHFHDLFQILD